MELTDEQKKFLIEIYESSRKKLNEASRIFQRKYNVKIKNPQIREIWEEEGFSVRKLGGYRYGLAKKEFKVLYDKYAGDVQKMADHSKSSVSNLVFRCYQINLKPKNVPKRDRSKNIEETALDLYPGQYNRNGKSKLY